MNPVIVQILNSLVRAGLLFLMGYLVRWGIMAQEEIDKSVAELTAVIVPVIIAALIAWYGAWRARQQQRMLITAQAMPAGVSTKQVLQAMKSEKAPDPTIPRDVAPKAMLRSTGDEK